VTDAGSPPPLTLDDLEAFVTAVEQLSYSDVGRSDYFSVLAQGLQRRLRFSQLRIRLFHPEGQALLAGEKLPSVDAAPAPDGTLFKPGETRFDRHPVRDHQVVLILDHCFLTDEILRLEACTNGRTGLEPESMQDLLGTCAVLAGNFLIRNKGRELQSRLADRQSIAIMISQLADAEIASQPECGICRQLQTTLEVDRVSLIGMAPRAARLLGSSTSSTIVRNSESIRLLERLALKFSDRKTPLEFAIGGPASPVSPELRTDMDDYAEETSVRWLKWIPILPDEAAVNGPVGFLLLEHFSADWPDSHQQRILELAEPHALHSAQRVLSAARRSLLSRMRFALADRKTWYGAWLGGIMLVAVLLGAIHQDLEIPVNGVLRPVHRAAVFAPVQGIVDQIPIHHGMSVTEGETLLVLRAPDLEMEERRISGELATLRSRLESLKSARIRNRSSGSRSGHDTDLSAEESDLETQFKGLTAQLALVREQMQLLVVKSPLNGQVDRWDLNQALAGRPVTHGQYLCDVLDVKGDWMIELSIPDDVVGYVLQAEKTAPCVVTYLFRTNSSRKYASRIQNISNSVQLDHGGQPVVLARVPAVAAESPFRVGAGVLARIHCGKRSLGFIYLREVIEFFRRTFWF